MPAGNLDRMPTDRRRLLIRTAAEEFASAGYKQASLNRIIARCGLSKSSFYHVIASKRELFDLVVSDLGGELVARAEIPAPESFAGPEFWRMAENVLGRIAKLSGVDESFLALGRMFYLSGAPNDVGNAVAQSLAAVEDWLRRLLLVGRESDAVRSDLPASLQARLVFAVLRALDEWTVHHAGTMPPEEIEALLQAQLGVIRRLLGGPEQRA